MNISPELVGEIVEHALSIPKVECCGLVAVARESDGVLTATQIYRAENIHNTSLKFEIDPMELYRITMEIEEKGWEVGAIYHSHVRSPPYPSQTDVNFAGAAGDIEWIIVGLGSGDPEVKSYLIREGEVTEVAIAGPAPARSLE